MSPTAQVEFSSPPWPTLPATPREGQGTFSPQSPSSPSQPTHDMDDYPQLPFPGMEASSTSMPFATHSAPSSATVEPIGTARGVETSLDFPSSPTWEGSAGTNNAPITNNGHLAPFPSNGPSSAPSWSPSGGPPSAPSWGTSEQAYPANIPVHQEWLPTASSIHHDTPLPPVAGTYTPAAPETEAGSANAYATAQRTMRFGYTLSGICVLLATILLMVVLFINLGLPKDTPHSQPQVITPHASVVPSPTPEQSITPTATNSYPGQQYIDTVTITNSHSNNAPAVSNFKVNQIAYINFTLHPNGHQGAVCLLWYVNDQVFSHYEFPVQPGALTAYSYTTLKKSGDGYVQLYWASTTACVDKLLAQQINFTVSS